MTVRDIVQRVEESKALPAKDRLEVALKALEDLRGIEKRLMAEAWSPGSSAQELRALRAYLPEFEMHLSRTRGAVTRSGR